MTPELPDLWRRRLADYAFVPQAIGESRAEVFALTAPGRPNLFLKLEPADRFGELPDEAARLLWLRSAKIPCAAVEGSAGHEGRNLLLMSAVPGHDMASAPDEPVAVVVREAARGLRQLHEIEVKSCPFDHSAKRRLAAAKRNLDAGRVDSFGN